MKVELKFEEDRAKKPSHSFTSTLLIPTECLYETNTRFNDSTFKALEVLLKSIEGVASVTLKDDYTVKIKIGSLFFPVDVQNKIKKALNI